MKVMIIGITLLHLIPLLKRVKISESHCSLQLGLISL